MSKKQRYHRQVQIAKRRRQAGRRPPSRAFLEKYAHYFRFGGVAP